MTTYTAEDFVNAEFARHASGSVAARFYDRGGMPWLTADEISLSNEDMADLGWVPVRETTMTDNDGRVERLKRQIAEQDITITFRNAEIHRLRAEVKAAAQPITLDTLQAAWEGAEQGEVAEGDVLIRRSGENFTVWVAGGGWSTEALSRSGHTRILHRAPKPPRPEGAETLPAGQVSNHYESKHWGLFKVPEVDLPPEWDGHTPEDAAARLRIEAEHANPQPRTITTSDEMDALPFGAVVLSDKGHAWQKVHHRAGFMSTGGWLCADPIYPGIYNDPDMQKGAIFYDGPATVLYLPEVDG